MNAVEYREVVENIRDPAVSLVREKVNHEILYAVWVGIRGTTVRQIDWIIPGAIVQIIVWEGM